jgi:membrane fusion protein YbhG
MKKVLRLLIPLLILAAGIGIWQWQGERHDQNHGTLKLYGNVDMREVQLAIDGNGRIAEMLAQEGDKVHKGQLLARLDAARQQAARDRAAAELEAQQAVVARMHAGSRPEDIRKARADLAAAEAQATDAASTAARLNVLSKENLASHQQAENATATAKAAAERVKAGRELLSLAEQGPRQEDVDAAEAQLKADQAGLALAQKELDDTVLHAPLDGIIRNRILEPGDMASPQSPIYTLAITDPMWVRAYVSETDLGHVHPGMQASVSTDSFPGKQYQGWVGYISPTAEFTPQSVQTEEMRTQLVYQVRVYVCNPQDELRLGMPASVLISLQQTQAAPGGNDPCHHGQ